MEAWKTLIDGLTFPEGPRWHEDRLWISDFYSHRVLSVGLDGDTVVEAEVPGQPSGLGWLPDGRLLVVSMTDRKLLRREADGLVEHADLSGLATFYTNDMVVDAQGRAYVGNFGFNLEAGEDPCGAVLARVDPDGSVHAVADDLLFPNGTVITPDGKTLIVGETFGARLTAFDIAENGDLSGRRVWAEMAPYLPDGICLDAEGAIWAADPINNGVLRLTPDGEVAGALETEPLGAYACMLGGPERRTLFVCACSGSGTSQAETPTGRILYTDVEIPGAGWPGDENLSE